jgi:hypothetical protein
MPSDLEMSLVQGGLTASLAKVIAGAIDNIATPKYTRGRAFGDSTPTAQLRMVTPDSRRYVLTNLDSSQNAQSLSQYQPKNNSHHYQDSQPATAQGTLATPTVVAGDYCTVSQANKDSVSQATVGLKTSDLGGRHARIDVATKAIQTVPFSVEVAQEQCVEARFEERPDGTVLKIALKNLKTFTLPDGTKIRGWAG